MFTTLISARELQHLMASGAPLRVFDCSFELMKPDAGADQYRDAHIPGSVYVHLDQHLSDKDGADRASGGRHPLPSRETFARRMASLGLSDGEQVVVLDRQGANYCGRLWWMLKWCGHEAVAVLDGGLQAWKAAGGALDSGPSPTPEPGHFTLKPAAAVTAPAPGSAARSSHSIRWPATFRARSTDPLVKTSAPTAASNPQPNCARSLNSCSPGATPPAWCTTAAAA
jgi:thiosulfate/3-mercaptopyruvate sulfurtransferase